MFCPRRGFPNVVGDCSCPPSASRDVGADEAPLGDHVCVSTVESSYGPAAEQLFYRSHAMSRARGHRGTTWLCIAAASSERVCRDDGVAAVVETLDVSPAALVDDVQRELLAAARRGERVRPLIWRSYSFYGFGAGFLP